MFTRGGLCKYLIQWDFPEPGRAEDRQDFIEVGRHIAASFDDSDQRVLADSGRWSLC